MAMNIKNEEAHSLALESITAAVITSLKERLARLKSGKNTSVSEQLLKIGEDCSKRLKPEIRKVDHGKMLHDDDGLPK
jgi:hypothetical protein